MTAAAYPLSQLYIHPLNIRSEPLESETDLLAASIDQVGLLQNLLGYADPARPGGIGIIGGGRRLRALQSLPAWADAEIPVEVCHAEDVAREWALTENTARKALNPADEIVAYRKMSSSSDPDQIARAFGVSGRYVRHRLKLAHLPDEAIDALRGAQISLDQAAALTHARSNADVLDILPRVIRKDWSVAKPEQIRNALQPDSVPSTDRRAMFVGLDLYRSAGGEVAESLFFEDARLLDAPLLDRLFQDALRASAENLQGETLWQNVVVCQESYLPHTAYAGMDRLSPDPIALPEADQEEYDDLIAASDERELTVAEADRLEELEARMAGDYSDEARATGTAFYVVDDLGELEFRNAFRPRETNEGEDGSAARVEAKAETIPQNLRDDLRIIKTLTVQTALLSRLDLLHALLHVTLCQPIAPYRRPLGMSPTAQQVVPSKDSNTRVDERLASALPGGLEEFSAEMLADALAMQSDRREKEIGYALARLLCCASGEIGPAIAAEVNAHPRDVWSPDSENYFKRLPVGMLDHIWESLVPSDLSDHSRFRALKKAQKAKELEDLFHDASVREAIGLSAEQGAAIDLWVPDELRWPHMDGTQSRAKPNPARAKRARKAGTA